MAVLAEYYTCLHCIKYIENRLLSSSYYSICPHYKVYDGNYINDDDDDDDDDDEDVDDDDVDDDDDDVTYKASIDC